MPRVTQFFSMRFGIIILGCLFSLSPVFADSKTGPAIKAVDMNSLSGNRTQLRFTLTEPLGEKPRSFEIENPAKLVLDFPGAHSNLSKEQSNPVYNTGVLRKAQIIEGDQRLRVVLDLNSTVPYEINTQGNVIFVTLSDQEIVSDDKTVTFASEESYSRDYSIQGVDFRRGAENTGRVIIDLSSDDMSIDMKEEGSRVLLRFFNTRLPEKLHRKLDVTDFATPVQMINTRQEGQDTIMEVETSGLAESMAYQADNKFTLEVRKLSREEKDTLARENFQYTGERLSLNFQDIEVRAVLQLIADFTGLNIVTSDTVSGNLTLRLRNVPWDQALDIILKTKGLDKRQIGNVMLIGPSEELAAREKLELQNNKQVEELAPLKSEYLQVNYAKALEIAKLLKTDANSILTERGSVSVDERTNTLIVQDTDAKLDEIRALVNRLDIPIRQVLIESRVVFANDNFEEALGVRFGGALKFRPGNEPVLGLTGSNQNGAAANLATQTTTPANTPIGSRLGVNLPADLPTVLANPGVLGLSIARLPGGTILDLELQALEAEGLGKIVANPRLMTSDKQTAYIESGEEIPYQESASSGAATTAFKKAVLRLEVTPNITPDDKVFLELGINQDSIGRITPDGFAINTREIKTNVLVANGDTVVLGGIYEQTKNSSVNRVPFLGRLPMVGWLFRNKTNLDNRSELMIFVTPKIVKEGMG